MWNRDQLKLEEENAKDDCGLKVGKDIARTLAATGSSKWTELQTSSCVVCVGCKPIWIEPAAEVRGEIFQRPPFSSLSLTYPILLPSMRWCCEDSLPEHE